KKWFDYSEERMIREIRSLPSARLTAESGHDPFPAVPDGIPISVTAEVKSDEALIEVDLRDTPNCQPSGLNLTEPPTRTPATAAAVISGTDARTGDRFVNQLILPALTGGPGGPDADGWLMLATASNSGMMTRDSVELDELRFPIRIREQRIMPDTEGAGLHRGS